jgi:hypothetical protein
MHLHVNKKTFFMVIVIVLIVISICCYKRISDNSKKNMSDTLEVKETTEVLGYIEHGPINPNISKDGELLSYEYNGGEFDLEYYMRTSGSASDIGFMVFINGEPLKFRLDNTKEYKYFNYMKVSKETEQYRFSLFFVPPDGNQNSVHNLDIVSIYNPLFIPDMKEIMSFTINHSALASSYKLHYKTGIRGNSKVQNLDNMYNSVDISNIKLTTEEITHGTNVEDFGLADENNSKDIISNTSRHAIYYNNQIIYNYLDIKEDILHITYKIVGFEGAKYDTTFFINHKPIEYDSVISIESTLEDGLVSVIDAYIDVSQLELPSLFYLISIPVNADEYPEAGIGIYKSPTILLDK